MLQETKILSREFQLSSRSHWRDSLRVRAFGACFLSLILLGVVIYCVLDYQINYLQSEQIEQLIENKTRTLGATQGEPMHRPLSHSNVPIYYHIGTLDTARLTADWPIECNSKNTAITRHGAFARLHCGPHNTLHLLEKKVVYDNPMESSLIVWAMSTTSGPLAKLPPQELFGLGVLILVLGYLTGLWISKSVEKALSNLAFGAKRLASGSYNLKLQHCGVQEMNVLTDAFNDMAKTIEEREKLIRQTAYKDQLTGLDNRAFLHLALKERIQNAREPLAILTWGVDNLDSINEVLGHDIADEVLIRVARKARLLCPENIVISRLEGNIFCMLIPKRLMETQVAKIPLARMLNSSVIVGPYNLDLECHAGLAHFPFDGETPETLLRRAEVARQLAKKTQRPCIQFEEQLEVRSARRLTLIGELKKAIAEEEFELYFQPKLNVRNNTITQAEVLIRWNHPTRGLIAPGGFIELAEQTGLIKEISRFVLYKVHALAPQCKQQNIKLSMNLSALDLDDFKLLRHAQELHYKNPEGARQITLEITESAAMKDPERAQEILERFAELGYQIAIDDFGAGYSSLAYLKRFPVSELKIDRSLVQNCNLDTDSSIILESTIEMGHIMGLVVTTEGVETDEEYKVVCRLGTDYIQGYWLSMPMPYDEFLVKHLSGVYDQETQPI